MACSITEAVPINAATEAEFLGAHKLLTSTEKYCTEKLGQAATKIGDFYQDLLNIETFGASNVSSMDEFRSLMKDVQREMIATKSRK